MASSPLPRLRTATSSNGCIEYATGAKYVGEVEGQKRKGSGTFFWPNGAKYEGEFADNLRQGQGWYHINSKLVVTNHCLIDLLVC